MKDSGYRRINLYSRIILRSLCVVICSILVFSCNSSKNTIKPTELNSDNIKYIFDLPVVGGLGDFSFYLVVMHDGKCVITSGSRIRDYIDKNSKQEIEYIRLYQKDLNKLSFCGKMLNDSTLEFKTNLFGEIEISVDHNPDFDRRGVDIDFVVGKDTEGNRWSMTCTYWSFLKKDSVYTDYQGVYPVEGLLKVFPHKKGHVFIPSSTTPVEAVRIYPGMMGGNFEIILNDIESSSHPFIKDKRKSSSQEINKITIKHNMSNRKSRKLVGRITSNGLVILSKQGNPTKQVMKKIYPLNDNSNIQEIIFGQPK